MAIYATVTDLQAAPGMSTVPDSECERLLDTAETLIDRWLGPMPVSETTGRKIDVSGIGVWRAGRLRGVTVALAGRVYRQPDMLTGERWQSQSGPDFKMSGPVRTGAAALLGDDLVADLLSLGLHRRTGRAVV